MTAWQDQPPQSRRQLRLSEHRNDVHDDGVDGVLPEEGRADVHVQDQNSDVTQAPAPHIESFVRPDWEAPARRSAAHEGQMPSHQQPRSRAEAIGRRAQHDVTQVGSTEQVSSTESATTGGSEHSTPSSEAAASERPSQIPSYGGPSFGAGAAVPSRASGTEGFRPRRSEDRSEESESPRMESPRAAEPSPAYRVRDFSPESRRSAFSSTSELSASDWNHPGAAGESTNLDYHTQQRPNKQSDADEVARYEPKFTQSVGQLPVMPQPIAPESATPQSATPQSAVSDVEGSVPVSAPSSVSSSVPGATATNSLSDLSVAGREASQPSPEHTLTRRQLRALREAAEPVSEDLTEASVAELAAAESPTAESNIAESHGAESGTAQTRPPLLPPAVPQPQSSRQLSQAMAEFDSLMSSGPSDVAVNVSHTFHDVQGSPTASEDTSSEAQSQDSDSVDHPTHKPYTLPTGHWSTQGAVENDTEVDSHEATLDHTGSTRGAAVTTSHLVISSVPTVSDLLLPFTPTGEIMITGTIDLPSSLGSTGAHPARYDHSDVDALLEASDREDSNVDSAPVRAIRAVSTHTSSRGLIGSAKPPRNSRLPMILAISTAAVAAVVVVLFVVGLMLRMI